jgi:hypothetical protein
MTDKQVKIPGPDHPITIEPQAARIVVSIAGRVVAVPTTLSPSVRARIHRFPTFRSRTSTNRFWKRRATPHIVPTRAIAVTTAFRLVDQRQSMPFGPTNRPILRSLKLRITLRSIRIVSMRSLCFPNLGPRHWHQETHPVARTVRRHIPKQHGRRDFK